MNKYKENFLVETYPNNLTPIQDIVPKWEKIGLLSNLNENKLLMVVALELMMEYFNSNIDNKSDSIFISLVIKIFRNNNKIYDYNSLKYLIDFIYNNYIYKEINVQSVWGYYNFDDEVVNKRYLELLNNNLISVNDY